MEANDVALYLKNNPRFFEEFADVIAEIFVPHPHGGHAIPIAERQIVTLREKNGELESRLQELIRFGTEKAGKDWQTMLDLVARLAQVSPIAIESHIGAGQILGRFPLCLERVGLPSQSTYKMLFGELAPVPGGEDLGASLQAYLDSRRPLRAAA